MMMAKQLLCSLQASMRRGILIAVASIAASFARTVAASEQTPPWSASATTTIAQEEKVPPARITVKARCVAETAACASSFGDTFSAQLVQGLVFPCGEKVVREPVERAVPRRREQRGRQPWQLPTALTRNLLLCCVLQTERLLAFAFFMPPGAAPDCRGYRIECRSFRHD